MPRTIITDGPNTLEVLSLLSNEIKNPASIESIKNKAKQIIEKSVDPIGDTSTHQTDGLLYGLIQSGKTSIITVASAMAADNGFQCIVILTSDIDLLYDQTLERVRQALRGLNVLGKNDWRDSVRFERQLRTTPFAIVCSKNGNRLNSMLDAFRNAGARGLSAIIIDDEADQASLNTKASKGTNEFSPINEAITNFRSFFRVNTYLQVTATPQALFLQKPGHAYRPSFTILSEPGPGYVGGEAFFGDDRLIRYVGLKEVDELKASHQPTPTSQIPTGLKKSILCFLIGATAKIMENPASGYAFLCHVSVNKRDHEQIVDLIDQFKENVMNIFKNNSSASYGSLMSEFQVCYDDLQTTQLNLPPLPEIITRLKFYINGTNIKLINATSNEEIKLDSAYNIFVGGTKLGRGVTIKNLLVSYYGRNPKRPNSDTVLQHARMYGYRENDLGVTRLFLPEVLARHFRLIHEMESALRELIEKYPEGNFEGLYISDPLKAARSNVFDPNSIGLYVGGKSYNMIYPLRTPATKSKTKLIDDKLVDIGDSEKAKTKDIDFIKTLIENCIPNPSYPNEMWDVKTIKIALEKLKTIKGDKAYVVVRRNRNLTQPRLETQGILSGGEINLAPPDAPTLFMYKQNANGEETEIWWPQLTFPDGNYVLAFSFDR